MTENIDNPEPEFNIENFFKNIEQRHEELEKSETHTPKPARPIERKKDEKEVQQDVRKDVIEDKEDNEPSKEKPLQKDYKVAFERSEKRIADLRKWGDKKSRENAGYKKRVRELQENGVISEEDAESLLSNTPDEDIPPQEEKRFLPRLGEFLDIEVANMKRYVDAPDIDNHISAFNHFMSLGQLSPPGPQRDQYEAVIEELEEMEQAGDRVDLLKRVIAIGQDYDEDVYKVVRETGDIRSIKKSYERREEDLKKEIDNLNKKIHKLEEITEDYTENPTRLSGKNGFAGKNNEEVGNSDSFNMEHLLKNRESYIDSYRKKRG
jgi:hypothetical protein